MGVYQCPACGARVPEAPHGPTLCPSCDNPLIPVGPPTPAPGSLPHAESVPLGRGTRTLFAVIGAGLSLAGGAMVSFFYGLSRGVVFAAEAWLAFFLLALGTLAFRLGRFPLVGAAVALASGVALLLKPIFRPMWEETAGRLHIYSATDATHVNFYLPGILLVALSAVLVWRMRRTSGADPVSQGGR